MSFLKNTFKISVAQILGPQLSIEKQQKKLGQKVKPWNDDLTYIQRENYINRIFNLEEYWVEKTQK